MVSDDAGQNAHHTRVIRKKYLFEAFACGVLPGHIALARIQPRCTNFFYHILKQRQPPRSYSINVCARRNVTASTRPASRIDRKSTRLNSSHVAISYAVFCLKKKKEE